MRIKIDYLVTVIISLLLIIAGHKLVTKGLFIFQDNSQEVVKARVLKVIERIEPEKNLDTLSSKQSTQIIFEAKVLSGERKGELITAEQTASGLSLVFVKEAGPGDSVLLINFKFDDKDEWHFNGYNRTGKLLVLGIIFILLLLFFGRVKGFNTILSLALTCGSIFAVFIPSILTGKNIYLMSILVCVYTIVMTLLIVIGFNKKAFTAAAGCVAGVLVTGIITVIMDRVLQLSGLVDEHSRYLARLPVENAIDLRAITFAGIIIGAMGAIMDVAMSISSALWELKEKAPSIKFDALLRSGLTIGRDIMGTMANTLILAYIGCSLSVVLILSVFTSSLLGLLNMEMIVVEILQALVGSFGILLTMPLTALICSAVYLREKKPLEP